MEIFEMAKVTRQKSGQPFDIWIDSLGQERNTKHNNPRIKAINNNVEVIAGFDNGEYTNFQTPKDKLQKFGEATALKKYVIKMKPVIELHWEGKIDDGDFINIAKFVAQGYDVLDAVDKAIKMWEN